MNTSTLHNDAASEMLRFAVAPCTLGYVLVAVASGEVCGLRAILLGDDADEVARELQQRWPRAHLLTDADGLSRHVRAVGALIETPRRGLDMALDIAGSPFQQRVWAALRTIPAGATASYSDVAARIGAPASVRAVAAACAANTLAVAIPCHRVVRRDGALSGYRWGVARKRALLEREAWA
ncbi:methylated-DNA--[protein]-cysteine S-methyltransferase [Lysobacter sp. TAF61]|uniref:methylated-DNA--[protein]-cysteine S-methyltransferase n=1 Tax=Lysobacter sp. TAF61 TaxID=3233072 RepID=UPI003F97AECA